jgi:hypothetical protein
LPIFSNFTRATSSIFGSIAAGAIGSIAAGASFNFFICSAIADFLYYQYNKIK